MGEVLELGDIYENTAIVKMPFPIQRSALPETNREVKAFTVRPCRGQGALTSGYHRSRADRYPLVIHFATYRPYIYSRLERTILFGQDPQSPQKASHCWAMSPKEVSRFSR